MSVTSPDSDPRTRRTRSESRWAATGEATTCPSAITSTHVKTRIHGSAVMTIPSCLSISSPFVRGLNLLQQRLKLAMPGIAPQIGIQPRQRLNALLRLGQAVGACFAIAFNGGQIPATRHVVSRLIKRVAVFFVRSCGPRSDLGNPKPAPNAVLTGGFQCVAAVDGP